MESLTPRPGIREHPDPDLENTIGGIATVGVERLIAFDLAPPMEG